MKMKQRKIELKARGFWVRGSGLVYIPKDRTNEIPRVIAEHHELEAQRDRLLLCSRRTL